MNRNRFAFASAVAVLLLLAASIAVGMSAPDDLRIPTHWGLDGRPDDYSGKWTALMIAPVTLALMSLILYFLPSLEPRKEGLQRSMTLVGSIWVAMLILCVTIQLVMISYALGYPFDGSRLLFGGVGLVLAVIGNRLGKSRSMYMIGVRTPWTLASEEVWIKTHRLAGKLMMAGGLAVTVAAIARAGAATMTIVLVLVIAGSVLFPVVFSYLLWRKEQH